MTSFDIALLGGRSADAGPVDLPAHRAARQSRFVTAPRNPYLRIAGPALVLGLWCLGSLTGGIDDRLIPAPWSIVATLWENIQSGYLGVNLLVSLSRAGIGLGIGVVLGVAFAVISGMGRIGEALLDGTIQIKRSVPTLGLIPLMILWFGIGETMKIIVITLSVLVPIYINTHAGVIGIDKSYAELAETLRLKRWQFVRYVVLPGALPSFFVGLRLAVTHAWIGLVVVEQVNAESGIGYMMAQAQLYGQTSMIFVGLVVYGLFGWIADTIVRSVQKKALKWQRTLV